MSALNCLIGAAAGAGVMYVFDPVSGARRRALVRDRLTHAGHQLISDSEMVLRDARHRLRGAWMALLTEVTPTDVPDDVLEQRVRARLGLLVRYPKLVDVRCLHGDVVLTGVVAIDEISRLVRRIRAMPGVQRVDHGLEAREPSDLPGADSPMPPRPADPRLDVMRRRWSPSIRAGAAALGGGLLLGGLRRGGFGGAVLAIAGIPMLARALTNTPMLESSARPGSGNQRTRPRSLSGASTPW